MENLIKIHGNVGRKYPNRKKPIPFTDEHKRKIKETMKGRTPKNFKDIQKKAWEANKGKVGEKSKSWKGGKPKCRVCNKQLFSYSAKLCKKHAGEIHSIRQTGRHWKVKDTSKMKGRTGDKNPFYGKHHKKETIIKIRNKKLGKKQSLKTRLLRAESMLGKNFKGGITPINQKIRHSIEFRLWREAVFARDNWTCQKYGVRSVYLHPHHIQNFAQFPELRFAIDNGITLSEKAHKEFHKIYGRKNNTKEQLNKFLCL